MHIDEYNIIIFEKILSKIKKGDENECWKWEGRLEHGCPMFNYFGRVVRVSKFIYGFTHGKIKVEEQIRHKCNNSLCCNPNHLYLSTTNNRYWNYVDKKGEDECWNWLGSKDSDGYGQFTIGHNTFKSHRVMYILTYGKIYEDKLIMHTCDNPSCVNPKHLKEGTYKDNMIDKVNKGRDYSGVQNNKGELNPNCKLTIKDINKIRNIYKTGEVTQKQLAKKFNVEQPHISRIILRKNW